jgi:hypothetical protein
MDAARAHVFISALAEGVDPLTGEHFRTGSPYQQTEIVRALYCAARALEAQISRSSSALMPAGPSATMLPVAPVEPPASTAAATSKGNAANANSAKINSGKPNSGKPNSGKPWSADEERELLEQFDAGVLLADIAGQLGRSLAGVEARLEKLGRLQPEQRTTTSRFPLSPSNERASNARAPHDRAKPTPS